MDPAARARRWLGLDAAYCAGAGLIAIVFAETLAGWFGTAARALVAAGIATVAWAGWLAVMSRRPQWRRPLRFVMCANLAAAAGIAALAAAAPVMAGQLLAAAVAMEVAAFAWQQRRILSR